MSKPTLADLRAFMAVARHRSFRAAADQLGVSRSALSHTLRSLEDGLGAQLLQRTTRSVSLTAVGERLLGRLDPLVSDLDQALEEVSGEHGRLSGTLRINGSEAAVRHLLRTVVPAFLARHPGVALELVAEGRLVDVVEQRFDAGVRLGEAVPKDMVAIRLGPELRFLAVASPSYLAAHPAPKVPDGLQHHQCIRLRLPSGKRYRWEFVRRGEEIAIDVPGALTLDNAQLMAEAAVDGLGIAYLPEPYARAPLDDGRLVTVLEDWCPLIPGLFLYFPRSRHPSASLRAFIHLIQQSEATRLREPQTASRHRRRT